MIVYFFGIVAFLLYRIIQARDKHKAILFAAAYMVGAEVFFRMTKALVFYETGKYVVILFFLMGMFFSGFRKNAFSYLIYILLLLPAVFITFLSINYDAEFRKMIIFNLSGPLCLAIAALYCYERTIKFKDLLILLDIMIYPLIAMTVYVYLYNPDISEVITGTASTSATSGGYGPNQVATMLGLGVFILYSRLLIPYKNKLVHFIMMFFLVSMAFRALVTFSRGGVIVTIIMVTAFSIILYLTTSFKTKFRITYKLIAVFGAVVAIWLYALLQTGGLIGNRYTNKDALGRDKVDITTGRGQLISADFEAFQESPVFGIGVGRVKSYYIEKLNIELPSHNELARMLSEHGAFGIVALLILLITPLMSILQGRRNIYFYPFIIFWALTISHSSMRIAAPAFIYALSLLNIDYEKPKATVHRKQLTR